LIENFVQAKNPLLGKRGIMYSRKCIGDRFEKGIYTLYLRGHRAGLADPLAMTRGVGGAEIEALDFYI
jgi:hypothetical protein